MGCQVFDELPNDANLARVKADSRFVQNDQFRFMHQRVGKPDALAITFGKLPDDSFADIRQAALLDDGIDPLA